MSEVGLYWPKVCEEDQWYERARDSFIQSKSKLGYNKHEEYNSTHQYGGMGIIFTNDLAHKTSEMGTDETGLGRWLWGMIKGKANRQVKIYSIYNPCKSSGVETVNEQHKRYYRKQNKDMDPRKQLLKDLKEELTKKHQPKYTNNTRNRFQQRYTRWQHKGHAT